MGDEVYVEVLIGDARVTVRADRGWTAPLGAPVGVRVDPARACFFDSNGKTAVHRVGEMPTAARGGVIQ
jgi:multiple sugar transport system ATP-binding protein